MKKEPSVFVHRKDLPFGDWVYASPPLDNTSANFTCENCQHAHIRFVHPLKHKRTGQIIKVGCVCAEHFLQDFTNPKLRENELKNYVGRRLRWPDFNWTWTQKGNLKLKKKGFIVVVRRVESGWWLTSYTRDGNSEWTPVQGRYKTPQEAKLAAFDALFPPG
jgi:hypothetical protein